VISFVCVVCVAIVLRFIGAGAASFGWDFGLRVILLQPISRQVRVRIGSQMRCAVFANLVRLRMRDDPLVSPNAGCKAEKFPKLPHKGIKRMLRVGITGCVIGNTEHKAPLA